MSGIPDGPWGWFGTDQGVYLATQYGGRKFVMDFARMGMNRAQPRFPVGGVMVPASELVKFAVGDGRATGFAEGKADPSVYRYDITDIDHPVARALVALPDLLAACKSALHVMTEMRVFVPDEDEAAFDEATQELEDAIAAAEGEPS